MCSGCNPIKIFHSQLNFAYINVLILSHRIYHIKQFVYRSRFSARQLETAYRNDLHDQQGNVLDATPAEKAIAFIRTSMLIRTAMFEGPAFFGLAVLMIAAQNGVLVSGSWLWINALPLAVLIALIVITFPTREKVITIFENNIKGVR